MKYNSNTIILKYFTIFGESFNMINVYIYVDFQKDARQLVTGLMEKDLLAHASIDKDNHSILKVDGKITEQANFVITGQTKAMLFKDILDFIEKKGFDHTKVYSVPITQCNENFGEIIRNNTLKI
ncbi:MAG: divalent cation tolerance protein CutA [Bacteroidota bacterium]|nr:divalent cation tolerance protein CutA [Bacteroidota bacterium]